MTGWPGCASVCSANRRTCARGYRRISARGSICDNGSYGRGDRGRHSAPGASGRAARAVGRAGGAAAPVAGSVAGDRPAGPAHEPAPGGQARRGQDHPGLRRRQAPRTGRLHHAGHRGHPPRGPADHAGDRGRRATALRGLASGDGHDPGRRGASWTKATG